MILLKNAIIKDYCKCIVKEESQKNEEMACMNKVQMTGTALLCQKNEDHLKG